MFNVTRRVTWYEHKFTRFEACRYAAYRLCDIRLPSDKWIKHLYIKDIDDIKFYESKYVDTHDWYVTGFTFDWKTFILDHGKPPSGANRYEHILWRKTILHPNYSQYILKKDIVFDVDRNDGISLYRINQFVLMLINSLKNRGYNRIECIFSGRGGYHVIIQDFERYLEQDILDRTAANLSSRAINFADMLLSDIFHQTRFDELAVHWSPMYPMGIRKMPYTITKYGTVAFPVTAKELETVTDIDYFIPDNILSNYKIKGRGTIFL